MASRWVAGAARGPLGGQRGLGGGDRRTLGRASVSKSPPFHETLSLSPSVSPGEALLRGEDSEATKGGILENQALQSSLWADFVSQTDRQTAGQEA